MPRTVTELLTDLEKTGADMALQSPPPPALLARFMLTLRELAATMAADLQAITGTERAALTADVSKSNSDTKALAAEVDKLKGQAKQIGGDLADAAAQLADMRGEIAAMIATGGTDGR